MIKATFISMMLFLSALLSDCCVAQQVIVLDGLGGVRGRYMQTEVNRLTSQGYDVTYRPWWRWRNAARSAPQASRVIGFSMGGARAIHVSRMTNASQLELVDPVSLHPIQVPVGIPTTVYRATGPTRIQSTPVYGSYQQYAFPTNHIGMPASFRLGQPQTR